MNVVPLALRTEVMDQRINSAVYVKVLSEPIKFLLSMLQRVGGSTIPISLLPYPLLQA